SASCSLGLHSRHSGPGSKNSGSTPTAISSDLSAVESSDRFPTSDSWLAVRKGEGLRSGLCLTTRTLDDPRFRELTRSEPLLVSPGAFRRLRWGAPSRRRPLSVTQGDRQSRSGTELHGGGSVPLPEPSGDSFGGTHVAGGGPHGKFYVSGGSARA